LVIGRKPSLGWRGWLAHEASVVAKSYSCKDFWLLDVPTKCKRVELRLTY